jgi:hydrogenase small subunit
MTRSRAVSPAPEFSPRQRRTEQIVVHVLWMTSGLGCDGDTVALTAATNPSLEDLLRGAIPGTPRIMLYNPWTAVETGEEFVRHWYDAESGRLDPFVLVLEGSIPNESLSGEGHWSGFGVDPDTQQPIPITTWIDRLAPTAAAIVAIGTCAAYGGVPAMRNNPTGAMGVADYLGHDWTSRAGLPIVNLPGCPVQPDTITETLLYLLMRLAGITPDLDLDEQGRPRWLFDRTVHERCDRVGLAERGDFAEDFNGRGCLVKLGCKGPVVKCSVPTRGWINGIGGCPNVGGICTGCTSPGFPDRFTPFMETGRLGRMAAAPGRFVYGPAMRYLRDRAMRSHYEVEPAWRRRTERHETGYVARW